ncbi:hypothetical protein ACWFR1_12200 [Streptomyces sp. NPDC055103]
MSPLPGQRAVQQPLRAGTSAQRALGRAAQASAGVLAFPAGIGWVNGQRYDIDLTAPPGQQARPILPCGCAVECGCDDESPGEQSETQERQG